MSQNDKYPIFTHWYQSLDWIMNACERMPKSVRFSLTTRIMNLSLDIQELIIEAIYQKDRASILRRINLQLEKLRLLFRIAFDRQYISQRQYGYIMQRIQTTGQMCGGWQKSSLKISAS